MCINQENVSIKVMLFQICDVGEYYQQEILMEEILIHLTYTIRTSLCSSKLKPRCHYNRTYRYKRRQKAVCCSLLCSTSSIGRSGELSDFERGLVIGCHISKKPVRKFVTLFKLSKSMVGDMIVK
jgi:hypothetical protein